MRGIVFMVFLFACHHEVKEELHLDSVEQTNSAKTTDETRGETKKQDPTDVDTKTTRSDNAIIVQDADGSAQVVRVPKDKPLALNKGAKVIGTVPLNTTVVDQSKHIGAVETEKSGTLKSTETDDKDKNVKVDAKKEKITDVGFSTKFYILAGSILLAVAALVFYLARSKLIRRLLGYPV